MTSDPVTLRLSDLRADADVDQPLKNVLDALSLALELRARYRVFLFEARQHDVPSSVELFGELLRSASTQVAGLLAELRDRLPAGAPSAAGADKEGAA